MTAGASRARRPPPRQKTALSTRASSPRRRLIGVLATMLVVFGVLSARLVQVQGFSAKRYTAFGESQRIRTVDLPAERGSLFDRNGRDLALSISQSTIIANPRLVNDPLATAEALAPLVAREPADLQALLTKDQAFVYLARKVDDGVAAQVKALRLPGVSLIEEPERFLPSGDLAAPVVGRVGTDNNGLGGLERQFEERLAGKPGQTVVERDPQGRDIPGGVRKLASPVKGEDLVLTLDRALQYETERALSDQIVESRAKGGMAIVMQTRTGEVLALANLSADPAGGSPRQATKNMAVTNVFEPGSVNKVITISGAIEEGIIHPEDSLVVPSTIRVADHVFSEHDPHPVERWSITEIVANSSNVGSIMIGQQLGKEKIDRYVRAYGLGSKTGLGFPGESAGILLDPKKWSGTSIGTVAIGQGLAVTGMQMLAAYNTVANAGTYVAPKLVKATVDSEGQRHPTRPSAQRRVVSARTAQQMTAMLNEVVRVGTGTLGAVDGYTVAGKTGTARKPLEGVRGYKAGAYVSSFVGFVPSERPELSAIVILDEPTPIFGGLVAAPVFAEIARYALRQFQVLPPPVAAVPTAAAAVPRASPDSARTVGEAGGSSPLPGSTPGQPAKEPGPKAAPAAGPADTAP
ncbi:MAG TPA: penicillin-binding protein 2 [Acidimicrobiales bacterium]|nr:penicillin-binding protein 2 [Acidimicrobiales bacterium]